MRTAVTSVGSVLSDIQSGLGIGSGLAGILTTLPVVCFSAVGSITPKLTRRFGPHRLLVLALGAMTVGLITRALIGNFWVFLLLSVVALLGGAIANVVMPVLVRLHFPQRIPFMTGVYTTALAVGTTAGSGLTVPIGDAAGGWRFGLAFWALFSAAAIIPWLPTVRSAGRSDHLGSSDGDDRSTHLPLRQLWHSRTARLLTVFFLFQSGQAYIQFGWFAKFLHAHGIAASTAGWQVAVLAGMAIPVSMLIPAVPPRHHLLLVLGLNACSVVAYVGLAVAPVGGAWVWMVLAGIGAGQFPLALVLIGLRSERPETTAALSAFVQSIGYVIAGTGPLLFGVLYEASGSWALPLTLLFVATSSSTVAGVLVARARTVDADLKRHQTAVA